MSKSKTMLIIGAKSDIALAIADKFASSGYNLQLAARNSFELDFISKKLQNDYQIQTSLHDLDILDYKSFTSFLQGLNPLPDIVLCAVGLLGNQLKDQINPEHSILTLRTNFEGPSIFLGEIANLFEKRGFGSIIGISSVAGSRGRASNYLYGSAKGGFTTFLSGLRNRLYYSKVNVLTVLPGYVRTKMTKDLKMPSLISTTPSVLSEKVFKNKNQSKEIYLFPWKLIMTVIKIIPEVIFKRLSI